MRNLNFPREVLRFFTSLTHAVDGLAIVLHVLTCSSHELFICPLKRHKTIVLCSHLKLNLALSKD